VLSSSEARQRETGIKGDHLDGQVLEAMRLVMPTIVSSVPDDVREIDAGETTLEGDGNKLHSMLLLTVLRVSPDVVQLRGSSPRCSLCCWITSST
jgi:hypothetical protein